MKLVFPNQALGLGGGARFVCELANGLVRRGHDVEIVIPEEGSIVWPLRATVTRVKELTATAIPAGDFIIPNFYQTVMPAWEAQKGRVVRLSLGYEPLWIKDDTARQTYLINAPIVCLSEWQRLMILHGTGRQSTVIHGGVDPSIFHPYTKLSHTTGKKTVFYIARSPHYGYTFKGARDFWAAMTKLEGLVPPFNLHIVHPEPDSLDAPLPCIEMKPADDMAMAQLYGEADVFVFSSYFEAFGLPPLEAMACGTAVVTTDCGGNRDYARHGENCLVVPPSDIEQLTAAIRHLLLNDADRKRVAEAGFKLASTWTWERTAEQFERILVQIATGKLILP